MIIAKVTSSSIADRFFRLETGTHTIGSDLECDVVLLDKCFHPKHLILHVSDLIVEVEVTNNAPAAFKHFLRGRQSNLKVGGRITWFLGDRVAVGDVHIELQGVNAEVTSTPLPHSGRKWWSLRVLSAAACLLALIMFANALFSNGSNASAPAIERKAVANLPQNPTALSELQMVRERLTALGVEPEILRRNADKWTGVLRVPSDADRRTLEKKLALLEFPFKPTIYVDEALMKAATIALGNTSTNGEVTSISDGVLIVSISLAEETLVGALKATLRTDVPGLKEIKFQIASNPELLRLRSMVTGMWLGDFPYIVLADNSVVRPGDPLDATTKLISVGSGSFVVDIRGLKQRVDMR